GQDALPASERFGETCTNLGALAQRFAELLFGERRRELELLERDVHDRNHIPSSDLFQDRGTDELHFRAVSALVDTTVVPAEATAYAGVGAVTEARRKTMFAVRLRDDGDRNRALDPIGLAALDVHGGEIETVVEHVLRAQQRVER